MSCLFHTPGSNSASEVDVFGLFKVVWHQDSLILATKALLGISAFACACLLTVALFYGGAWRSVRCFGCSSLAFGSDAQSRTSAKHCIGTCDYPEKC